MRRPNSFFLLLLTIVLSSCSARVYHLDYTNYPKLPELPMSLVLHGISEAIPPIEAKAYYGTYGGPGNHAGKPIDLMDEYFRRHDVAYLEGYKYRQLREADRVLVSRLGTVDESTLTPFGKIYRKRAMHYFSSPISKILGKPLNVILGLRKKPIVIPGNKEEANAAFDEK